MINYEDLTLSQKKYIDLTVMFFPEIGETITWEEVTKIHDFFFEKRSEDKRFKVGLPLWMTKANTLGRGVFHFPKRENFREDPPIINSAIEQEYIDELKEFGIEK